MQVLITSNAQNDINEFLSYSLSSTKYSYINDLLSYTYDLANNPKMGKYVFDINTKHNIYNVRQLIYKQHKVFYFIDSSIHIIGIPHVKRNPSVYISKLKDFISTNE